MNTLEVTHTLTDGSTAVVTPTTARCSMISRFVDGTRVWGQVFADAEDHPGQIQTVLVEMNANPNNFVRWWNQ